MPPHLDLHRSVGRTDSRTVSAIAPKHKLCSKDELVLSRPDGSPQYLLERAFRSSANRLRPAEPVCRSSWCRLRQRCHFQLG
jgi:hypothetical protein